MLRTTLLLVAFTLGCDAGSSNNNTPTKDVGPNSDSALTDAAADSATDSQPTPTDAAPELDGAVTGDGSAPDAVSPDAGAPADCAALAARSAAQLQTLWDTHGGVAEFPAGYVELLSAFLAIDDLAHCGDYATARTQLDAVFDAWPLSDARWWGAGQNANDTNAGSPVAYYGLRMLDEVIRYGLAAPAETSRPVVLTVVLAGCSTGIQPTTRAEFERGEGVLVRSLLDPGVVADDHHAVHQSLDLFTRYIHAMSQGRLSLETRIHALGEEPCLPASATAEPFPRAGADLSPVWGAVPAEVQASTDWWWVMYPSHVPEQWPDFERAEFITGGMGRGPNGGPLFIVDDRWITRKPPHLGQGPYTEAERRAYLPQWLQHEFFHHLFQRFSEFELEASSHQWFDRGTWPDDFVGAWEPDYYAEALHRRLQTADPPLHTRLRYRSPNPEELGALEPADVLGAYERRPVQNGWHRGQIERQEDETLIWRNSEGVQWRLDPDLPAGRLRCGPDNPYFEADSPRATDFLVNLARDAEGDYVPGALDGFTFGGELYTRLP